MTPDSPAAVRVENDGYWEHYLAAENPPYEIRGKYLFFSEDRERLVRIAIEELTNGGFHLAKTHLPGRNLNAEYVLCLYYSDDSRKHELAAKYKTQPGLKYRYWKSDAATHAGSYSEEFLDQLPSSLQRRFQKKTSP